jgi:hypothetical protein
MLIVPELSLIAVDPRRPEDITGGRHSRTAKKSGFLPQRPGVLTGKEAASVQTVTRET